MQDQPVTIRKATPEDRDDVVRLFGQYGFDDLENWADRCIRQEKTTMFLAFAGEQAVGFGRVAMIEDGHGHIYDLYTDPAYRGRGIAGAMMQTCEDWARERKAQDLQLNVYQENHKAQDIYKKRGYAIAFNGISATARAPQTPEFHYCMVKHLNGPA